jgi:hypothetical protein
LRHLDKEESVSAKAFFMTAWNGNDGYTLDRVGRGTVHIEHVCLSILGGTQPSVISEYVSDVHKSKTGGDGFIQRFALATWPDVNPAWRNVDELPDLRERDNAWEAFKRVDKLRPDSVEAQTERYHDLPFLHFSTNAQAAFNEWRQNLQTLIRDDELAPALQSHFSKYPKLVPTLALLNHLAEPDAGGPIPLAAIEKAICFTAYLESHARRIYASGIDAVTLAAKAILMRIRKGDLKDAFSARDVHRPKWSHLTERDDVQAGLDLLCDLGWIAEEPCKSGPGGGRPTKAYRINPGGFGSFGS